MKKFLDLIRRFFHATLDPDEEGIPYCADIKCKKVFGIEFSEKMSVVSVWYGGKEPNMKKAVAAIRKVYPKAEDHPFPGIGHGEILSFPEEMVREIKKFVEDENA